MNRTIITSLKIAILAIVLAAFTSSSFAAVDMFLKIKDLNGKVVSRCEVDKDGKFECPKLPAGTYTAALEWSWGVNNGGAHGPTPIGTGKTVSTENPENKPSVISFEYNVKAPRDVATGQASGKRQHKPILIRKEIDKATPQLSFGSFTVDEDCDGITGTISAKNRKGNEIEVLSWSWGVSNSR
jgi:hypothetical protein